nr:unnamed protein product [Callosobruchus analis]
MTGGGPEEIVLKEVDQNILSIIKPVMVEGHNVPEPLVSKIVTLPSLVEEHGNVEVTKDNESVLPEVGGKTPRHARKIPQRPHGKLKKV